MKPSISCAISSFDWQAMLPTTSSARMPKTSSSRAICCACGEAIQTTACIDGTFCNKRINGAMRIAAERVPTTASILRT